MEWEKLQKIYDDEKISTRELAKRFDIHVVKIYRATKKGLFKTRDKSELSLIISEKNKLRKHSEQTRKKISDSRKKYLANNPDKVPYLLNHSSKESYPEKYFSDLFLKESIEVERYFRVGNYELDFCISYKKIDIEIDGDQHYLDENIVQHDIKRNEYLEKNGWTVFRIKWSEYKKMNYVERKNYILELKEKIGSVA